MEKPNIAQKGPVVMEIDVGTYWWCQCGLSNNQPYCDGSHKTTSFEPMEVVIDRTRKIAWCACKQTGNAPFCDGTHKKL
jgi:CDGSH-type Zn-finger protein